MEIYKEKEMKVRENIDAILETPIWFDEYVKETENFINRLIKDTIKANELQTRIDKAIEILKHIYMLDNVTITNNVCEEIDKAIEYLDKEFPWEDGQPDDIYKILKGEE